MQNVTKIPFFWLVTLWYPGGDIDRIYIYIVEITGACGCKALPPPLFEKKMFFPFLYCFFHFKTKIPKRIIGSYTSPYWRSGISSTSVRNSVFLQIRWISLTSGRNPRSSIRTSASICFFRFNLKTKHVDFIHSFACQCHVYYTTYYNATCNAVNTHLGEIS